MRPFPIALAATLHDPTAALRDDIERALPRLRALYAGVAVATSPPTSKRIVRQLAAAGVHAGTPPANTRGPLYRMAIRGALETAAPAVHYVDFDRAVHWLRVAPRELAAVLRLSRRQGPLLVGRTATAHASHHRPLWATELVAGRLIADELGVAGRLDVLVPSFVLPAGAAGELARRSRARGEEIYGEWAALVAAAVPQLAYVECRGLDWETPDRFRRAVRRAGLAAWRRRQETPGEWALRTAMAEKIVAGFERTRARWPSRPRLVRFPPRSVR
ncbi:MAG TPA: hypothetical protein VMS22_15315 [Candidatus Eisenbacteria bacterium]|nr:hypothetical protein [Candidatus Eisenbacteria bacterium]